jgi:hypothetical protein
MQGRGCGVGSADKWGEGRGTRSLVGSVAAGMRGSGARWLRDGWLTAGSSCRARRAVAGWHQGMQRMRGSAGSYSEGSGVRVAGVLGLAPQPFALQQPHRCPAAAASLAAGAAPCRTRGTSAPRAAMPAGNLFDLGAAASAQAYESGDLSFAGTREKLLPRPWVSGTPAWGAGRARAHGGGSAGSVVGLHAALCPRPHTTQP